MIFFKARVQPVQGQDVYRRQKQQVWATVSSVWFLLIPGSPAQAPA